VALIAVEVGEPFGFSPKISTVCGKRCGKSGACQQALLATRDFWRVFARRSSIARDFSGTSGLLKRHFDVTTAGFRGESHVARRLSWTI
jgi:hypothetical protein